MQLTLVFDKIDLKVFKTGFWIKLLLRLSVVNGNTKKFSIWCNGTISNVFFLTKKTPFSPKYFHEHILLFFFYGMVNVHKKFYQPMTVYKECNSFLHDRLGILILVLFDRSLKITSKSCIILIKRFYLLYYVKE